MVATTPAQLGARVQAAHRINQWYHQQQIAGSVDLTEEVIRRAADTGAVVLPVTETRVGNIKFMFVDSNGDEVPVGSCRILHGLPPHITPGRWDVFSTDHVI
jgi:hypothetical protein